MFPILLPENVMALPIGHLHLETRVHNALVRAHKNTVGALLDTIDSNFTEVGNFGATAAAQVYQAIAALTKSVTANNDVDWEIFWTIQGINLLPSKYQIHRSPEEILKSFSAVVKSVLCYQRNDDRDWRIIQRRFGLDKTERLSLDELGTAFRLTRERVRQIERAALSDLRDVLLENNYGGKTYHVHPEILATVKLVFDKVSSTVKDLILESDLFDLAAESLHINIKFDAPTLTLLFHLFGMNRIGFDNERLTALWEYGSRGEHESVVQKIELIDALLTRDKTIPLEEFDILFNLNNRLPKDRRFTALQLRKYLDLCSSIERRPDGLIQAKFECLKNRGDQVERILLEANKPLHVAEIIREMNRRLLTTERKRRLGTRNIAGRILSQDERFVPLGKSGHWGLANWAHLQTGSIAALMEECLVSFNRPATVEELVEYITTRRPASRKSVEMYLQISDIFKKSDRTHWGLSTWAETQNATIWSPEQVADFVVRLFKDSRAKELEFTAIRQALMAAADVTARQARGMLSLNPVILIRRELKPSKIYTRLNPDYRKGMLATNLRARQKRETAKQKAERAVKDILEAEANKQMELRSLVARMQNEYSLSNKSCYFYIAQMTFVEKIDLPDSKVKICRLKGSQTFYFPQLAKLRAVDLAIADEAMRAIERLTIDDVDIGLFMLGRLFEDILKDFMIGAERTRVYPVNPNNYSKLNNMIDWVKSQAIISDSTVLHFLRQERNARAHGSPPSLEERRMLMNTSAWVAGIYLDYVLFFSEKKKAYQLFPNHK